MPFNAYFEFMYGFKNYLATRSLRSRMGGDVVRFSGKARKTNHFPLFCERSEQ
ncbi:MAG: hypothetical protein U5L45_23945 [Saprospiraceae bacterium]|nr:hypothetical protein [Saprospiraceae bacterium]